MQLTQFSDFSSRVLIYLVKLPEPGVATSNEIADCFQISRNLKGDLHEAQQAFLAVLDQYTLPLHPPTNLGFPGVNRMTALPQ